MQELERCLVQLTDFAGVRMGDGASARMSDCRFEHNGLMGGSAVKLSSAAAAIVSRTTVVSGKSVCVSMFYINIHRCRRRDFAWIYMHIYYMHILYVYIVYVY